MEVVTSRDAKKTFSVLEKFRLGPKHMHWIKVLFPAVALDANILKCAFHVQKKTLSFTTVNEL